MNKPFLSIIIPAHNEEHRLPLTFEKLRQYTSSQNCLCEIIVVENASTDATVRMVEEWQVQIPELKLISLQQPGKGNAIKTGMLAATGQYRFMADADLSMPIEQVSRFLPPDLPGIPVAIASREVAGSRRIDEPAYRHFIGRVFNLLVRMLVLPGVQDTQCGFKCFTAEAAERIFQLQTLEGWSFDVEILAIARELGYPVHEVPITWVHTPGSSMHIVRDSWRMFKDLLRIRGNIKKGLYRAPAH